MADKRELPHPFAVVYLFGTDRGIKVGASIRIQHRLKREHGSNYGEPQWLHLMPAVCTKNWPHNSGERHVLAEFKKLGQVVRGKEFFAGISREEAIEAARKAMRAALQERDDISAKLARWARGEFLAEDFKRLETANG